MSNSLYKDDKYEIKLDEELGFFHLFPIPSKEELEKYYEKEFYSQNFSRQINDSSDQVQEEEREFIEMQYADIVEILDKESVGKRIFDIGCGYGNFLKFCSQKGYEVGGIDPSEDAVTQIKSKLGFNVVKTDIEDVKGIVKEKYHTAVLLNVLEHLRKPQDVLIDIHDNVLEDKGLLVVRVPNEFNKLQLIANQEFDLKQWWVCPPQHINYFTIQHLENLINKSGYEVFLKESSFPLEMFILFGDQYVGNPQLGKIIHNKRVNFEKILTKHDNSYKRLLFQNFAEMGLGREITIYARKK